MDNYLLYLGAFFIIANCASFLFMFVDKVQSTSKHKSRRISEGWLFFMAVCFGSIGVYVGMFLFRHKTRKWYFIVGIPLVILQNISFLLILYYLFVGRFCF